MIQKIKLLLAVVLLSHSFGLSAQETSSEKAVATYYFIRHAEKNRSNPKDPNPHLTEAGEKRAANWAHFFKDIPLKAVYSTSYHRTQETALPTANSKSLSILTYDARKLDPSEITSSYPNSPVLIVGHSNTTPAFVNAFVQEALYGDLDDSDNGSVFMVQIFEDRKLVHQFHID